MVVVKFPQKRRRHARASVKALAEPTNVSRVISFTPFAEAIDVIACQYSTGIEPRDFQLETVEGFVESNRATSPVPPNAPMIDAASMGGQGNSRPVKMSIVHKIEKYTIPTPCLNFHMAQDDDEIARRLRLFQLATEKSQAEVAGKLNIGDNAWSQFLSAKRPVTLELSRKLYHEYGVSHDWILENIVPHLSEEWRNKIASILRDNPQAAINNKRGRKPKTSQRVKKMA